MLTVSEIRRQTYDNTYRKGRAYFQQEKVKKIEVHWHEGRSGQDTRVEGEVRGSGRSTYLAELQISPEEEITDYRCECPAYDSYWGMCKHCVALGLAYQDLQKKQRQAERQTGVPVQRETSGELSQILYGYSVRNRMNRLGGPDGEMGLECYFQTDRNGLQMEMKVGGKRKYVVKNIIKLVRDAEEIRDVRYGASLQFVHDRSAFDPDSWELLQLVRRAVAGRYPDYRDGYYEVSANFRYLLLRGDDLSMILDHYLGRSIRLDEKDVPVRDGNPPLTLYLREVRGGAELRAEPMEIYDGGERVYLKKDETFWRPDPDFRDQVLPLWQLMMKWQNRPFRRAGGELLFLSRNDYGSFCGNLLPRLEPFVIIDSGELDLAEFAPAEPEFFLYLGMPEEDVIEAAARVRYDQTEYDLLDGKAALAGRNPERENEIRSLVQKYFSPKKEGEGGKRRQRRVRSMLDWLDDVPVRDLDADDGRAAEWDLDTDEYGLPVRDLDADLMAPVLRAYHHEGQPEIEAGEHEGREKEVLLPQEGTHLFAVGEDGIFPLVDHGLAELAASLEMYVDESIRRLSIRPAPKVNLGIGISGELIDLDVEVEGMDPYEIAGILDHYRKKKKYYRLRDGDFVRLADNGMETLSELSEGLGLTEKDLEKGQIRLPLYRAMYLDGVFKDGTEAQVERLPSYRQLIRGMRDFSDSDFEIPAGIRAKLRRYQREGFRWLCTLCEYQFGGILADDMGLGKTLQMITLLVRRKEGGAGPSLVAAPASLVYNWESEVQRFAPMLSVQVIAGSAAERKEQIAECGKYDVNITSYDLLKRDVDIYEAHAFDCMILDEAQYIKNAATQAAQSVKRIRAAHRFALTGTPIENRLSDLWSIFDFLMPGYLFAYSKFREEWEAPIVRENDEQAVRRLSRMVTPFILRRRKQDVLKDLPDKLEENVVVQMTPEQKKVYDASTERVRLMLRAKSEKEIRESRIQILAELTRLRQLCCSPELVYDNYAGGSGKVDACLELLENAVEAGHRVLVFSQFTSMLELLQRGWERTGKEYLYLSGRDSKKARQQMVEHFQTGEIPVFFISLKAGGTGLNLTAADIVIHVDPWWNVAAQNQATDRTHRIGQNKVVSVMKLVAKGTIEEKILRLQEKKAALADSVVEGEGVKDFTLDKEELMALFDSIS